MEPGCSREGLTDYGGPEQVDLREETPGEEAENVDSSILKGRGGDTHGGNEYTVTKMKAEFESDRDTEENIKKEEDEDDRKYEEELEPRIQVRSSFAWMQRDLPPQ